MTVDHRVRSITAPKTSVVMIAGVPWPTYKVAALMIGFAVLAIIGMATNSAAAAVLTAAAVGTAAWVAFGVAQRIRH